jgi:hypothetical protein
LVSVVQTRKDGQDIYLRHPEFGNYYGIRTRVH